MPDTCFLVHAHVHHVDQKFWHTYMIKNGDVMVIVSNLEHSWRNVNFSEIAG